MIFAWDFTENFLEPLGYLAAVFMFILGAIWIIYAVYETKRRGSFKKRKVEDWDFDRTKFLKGLTYLGFLVGLFSILVGAAGLMFDIPPSPMYQGDGVSVFTSIMLIVLGILTFLKPANDLPIASIVGLMVGVFVIILITLMLPPEVETVIGAFINFRLFLGIVFIIIFAIVALIIKFYTAGFMAVSKGLSWPPIAVIVTVFCLLQGFFLLVLGISITGLF